MRADFVNKVARILNIKKKDLIEKDLILHQILFDLSGDRFFAAISLEDVDSGTLFAISKRAYL